MMLLKISKPALRWGLLAGGAMIAAVIGANVWMLARAETKTVRKLRDVTPTEVGIVLGSSPRIGRWKNPFFENRMDAAAELFQAGRVRRLLVSGDNHRRDYDEPTAMRDALVARGVPAAAVTLDYAGFRTLDTMARAKAVFGIQKAILISDDFHEPRCLFLAHAFGLEAVAYPSARVPLKWAFKTEIREMVARACACLDVYVFRTKPKYYGPAV